MALLIFRNRAGPLELGHNFWSSPLVVQKIWQIILKFEISEKYGIFGSIENVEHGIIDILHQFRPLCLSDNCIC